ncbi:MAG TPA: exonuclease domain-containing protein [Bacteroidia bacterium]|jgi:DNA polymerase-3 subunit epsilon|nr:exonuclease domain-containing protein [Bacteroidia bacterium]
MAKLNLTRPLAFFDIETTGLNIASDRIVEISILKVFPPDGNKKESKTLLINPTIPIPKEVTKVHGISDLDVANEPTFKEYAQELSSFLQGCDLAGYNCNYFDIPLLMEEFLRAGIDFNMKDIKMVDVQAVFHKKEERTLSAAYKFYCGKVLEKAHSAEADINATYEILEAQLERYTDLGNDVSWLHNFTSRSKKTVDFAGRFIYNDKNVIIFNFGKHAGKSAEEVFKAEPSYYAWMMNGDFSLHTKKVITEIYKKTKERTV